MVALLKVAIESLKRDPSQPKLILSKGVIVVKYTEIYQKGLAKLSELGVEFLPGAETASTIKKAREYLDSLSFELRLIDSNPADTSCTFFGVPLKGPVMTAALSGMTNIDKNALVTVARGIKEAGLAMWMGVGTDDQLQAIIDTGVPTVKIVKPYKDLYKLKEKINDAVSRGVFAVGTDITYFYGGKVGERLVFKDKMGPRSLEELREIISGVEIPFIIKGVLSVVDAIKAKEAGAQAIVVSNHGGGSLDHAVPPYKMLPEIRKAVGENMVILVDGSIERGTDVLKAIVLGADYVLAGRIFMLSLAAAGQDGVMLMAGHILDELERAMSLTGMPDLKHINREILRFQ